MSLRRRRPSRCWWPVAAREARRRRPPGLTARRRRSLRRPVPRAPELPRPPPRRSRRTRRRVPPASRSCWCSWWRTTRCPRCAARCRAPAAGRHATATRRTTAAMTHPSLPNYLAIAGGSTFGVTDDNDPSAHPEPGSLGLRRGSPRRTDRAGLRRLHALGLLPTSSEGDYAVRHNPWTYFPSEPPSAGVRRHMAGFGRDVRAGHLPQRGDGRSPTCATTPTTARSPPPTRGCAARWAWRCPGPDYRPGGSRSWSPPTRTTAAGQHRAHRRRPPQRSTATWSRAPLSHLSLSRLYTEVLGVPPLRAAAKAPSMAAAFHLPLARP